ncbi:hypothetical protein [Reinekea sp.]|jgi:hypothetical protein|uniref:hypothetical protein n=1 Tax=Reinekea sp. TaxID=1970455 RepID=UPI003989514D
MSIVSSFICTALNIPFGALVPHLSELIEHCPVSKGMSGHVSGFLQADPALQDDLWRFSLAFDLPHALVCESYWLEQKAQTHRKVG